MKKSKPPFHQNKVTFLLKYLVMAVFVLLPFIGFWLGMKYKRATDLSSNRVIHTVIPPKDNISTVDWKTFSSKSFEYAFKYPANYSVYSPTPDGKSERELLVVSDSGQNNLSFGAISKKGSISFSERTKNYQYWDWTNKQTNYLAINGNQAFQMDGLVKGKLHHLWAIEGKNNTYVFVTLLDYDPAIITQIINTFTSN